MPLFGKLAPRSVSFKAGSAIVAVVLLMLSLLGYLYSTKFSSEVESRAVARLKLPGILMNKQLLRYESVGDPETMASIIGEEFVEGTIFNADGKVYYSTNKANVGKNIGEITRLPLPKVSELGDDGLIITGRGAAEGTFAALTPLFAFKGGTPFFYSLIVARTKGIEEAKAGVVSYFLLASILSILILGAVLFAVLNSLVVKPLRRLEESADRMAGGMLDIEIESGQDDEIGRLAVSFMRMRDAVKTQIDRLEQFNQRLENIVRERTADLSRSLIELENAQQLAHVGSWTFTIKTGTLTGSREFFRIVGGARTLAELEAMQHPEDTERLSAIGSARNEAHAEEPFLVRLDRGGEGVKFVSVQWQTEIDKDGVPTVRYGTIQDITELEMAFLALHESEKRFGQLFNSMAQGVALFKMSAQDSGNPENLKLLDVNPAFERLSGLRRSELFSGNALEVFPILKLMGTEKLAGVAFSGKVVAEEVELPQSDRQLEVTAYSPAHGEFAIIATDITDRRKADEERRLLQLQVLHSQKLESLGVMAGGVAHDFNNLLTVIQGHADLALLEQESFKPAGAHLEQIRKATERAAQLARQMLAYAGKAPLVVRPVDVNFLVEDLSELLRASLSKRANLTFTAAPEPLYVMGDSAQLTQVVMNLVTNASEALEGSNGFIKVSLAREVLTRERLDSVTVYEFKSNFKAEPGEYAILEVADDGCGMDEKTVSKVFDPFFTTKFQGRGLGMAAVSGIIWAHKGVIKIQSSPGVGTKIRVALPLIRRETETVDTGESTKEVSRALRKKMALVIDDEEEVRQVAVAVLKSLGYAAKTASDGAQGLSMLREDPEAFDFVLLDLTMPGMDGYETLPEIRKLSPSLWVILASGYGKDQLAGKFPDDRRIVYLSKPFSLKSIAKAIDSLS